MYLYSAMHALLIIPLLLSSSTPKTPNPPIETSSKYVSVSYYRKTAQMERRLRTVLVGKRFQSSYEDQ